MRVGLAGFVAATLIYGHKLRFRKAIPFTACSARVCVLVVVKRTDQLIELSD